ncbi:MAG TPA: DUF3999 family protein [Thermoanaerobaculia bacterium]|nr:DUF3999 family protein [Thermoanaerobaculia bacterium]
MRRALRRAASCLLLLAAACPAGADAGAYLYTRPLDVPAAGPVAAPLDLATLHHLGAGSSAVFAADGREVPSRMKNDCCRVKADLVEARREGESWHLLLDLGAEPPLHEQLHFRLRRVTAATVLLEGSDDRAAWRPLAEGNLFRLGTSDELERSALVYPANRHRWLRLTWPAAAGTPELREIEIVSAEGRVLAVGTEAPACRREGRAVVCGVPLPAPYMIGLRFHLRFVEAPGAAAGRLGYRLSQFAFGTWATLAEGTAPLGTGALSVPLPPEPLHGEALRLELYGDPAPPRSTGWTLELAQPVVIFEAPRAGRYTLAYGGGTEPAAARPAVDSAAALRVVPGPERRQALPPLPAAATAPGAALDADDFDASWPVRAPRARPGEVVRLELPPAVLAAVRSTFNDLRLAAGERQLPFVRLEPRMPALALSRPGLRPRPDRGGRTSRVALAVDPRQRYGSLSLTAPSPFRRVVTVSLRETLRPLSKPETEEERSVWDCSAPPPLPCRWQDDWPMMDAADRVTVRFEDGDNPPLAWVDAAVWRERLLLVFVWPAGGEVRLLAGNLELSQPRYDLEALAPQLLARPWRAAAVDVGGGTRGEAAGPAWLPLLVPAALAVAGAALLLILRQAIGKRA